MSKPIVGKLYTYKDINDNGWNPCKNEPCKSREFNRCSDQCTWAYWNQRCLFYWNGTEKDGVPVYADSTWERAHFKNEVDKANKLFSEHSGS